MSKLTIAQAAEHFKISKEAIHNRIRRGSLDCVIENGMKYVQIGETQSVPKETPTPVPNDSKYYSYIEKENERLKEKIDALEEETKKLRTQREQMLIDEKIKIESIYKERDEQLKNVLNVVASKFLTHMDQDKIIEESITAEIIDEKEIDLRISLKAFLKLKAYKTKRLQRIKENFKKASALHDSRLSVKKGKIYLDPSKYDYKDLLNKKSK